MREADPACDVEHRELYRRLLEGDALAPADLAEAFLDQLAGELQRFNPQQDPHLCTEAAVDAILALIKNPRSYDPARGTSLAGYLRMSARGDLQNRLRKERRHSDRRADLEAVELSPTGGKYLQDGEADPIHILIGREELEEMIARIPTVPAAVLDELTEQERVVLSLIRQGQRKTEVYARALGIDGLPVAEQRQVVKRLKDRVQKRLQRAGYGDERQT
jgi:RNA polymerase sigma factor (sigma-70 family)